MTYEEFFKGFKLKFDGADVSDVKEHLAFQFNITGEAEGAFYVEVKDGQLSIEPYEYYDRDAIFITDADTLEKISDGKSDPIVAFTVGKLKVEGNIDKALKFKDLVDKRKKQMKKK